MSKQGLVLARTLPELRLDPGCDYGSLSDFRVILGGLVLPTTRGGSLEAPRRRRRTDCLPFDSVSAQDYSWDEFAHASRAHIVSIRRTVGELVEARVEVTVEEGTPIAAYTCPRTRVLVDERATQDLWEISAGHTCARKGPFQGAIDIFHTRWFEFVVRVRPPRPWGGRIGVIFDGWDAPAPAAAFSF